MGSLNGMFGSSLNMLTVKLRPVDTKLVHNQAKTHRKSLKKVIGLYILVQHEGIRQLVQLSGDTTPKRHEGK
jgi:hypothetical protein